MFELDPDDPCRATATVKDAEVKPHRYEVQLHPGTEGYRLANGLTKTASGAIGELLVGANLDKATGGLDDALDAVDISRLGPALQQALGGLPQPIVMQVLKYTNRDGKPLSDPAVFDVAYRRNYFEVIAALYLVCRFNRFFPVPDSLWDGLAGMAAKAKDKVLAGPSGTPESNESRSAPHAAA